MGVTFVEGRLTPGLSALIFGSFQLVMLPRNMSATTGPVRCRLLGTPFTLYVTTVAPSAHGICRQPLQAVAWSADSGASLAPKSTARAVIWSIPPPDPMAP